MKGRVYLTAHGLIAISWVSLALGISIKVALLGNLEATLAKQRGADFKTRSELAFTADRLRAILEQAASPVALELSLRQLDLPLQPPVITAGNPRPASH
jgi:hypothetical protein